MKTFSINQHHRKIKFSNGHATSGVLTTQGETMQHFIIKGITHGLNNVVYYKFYGTSNLRIAPHLTLSKGFFKGVAQTIAIPVGVCKTTIHEA